MNLGERIYALRVKRGLSQGELADQLDVSRQSVSKWENNNAVPDLEKLLRLSEIFGITLDELVKGTAEDQGEQKTESAPAAVSAPAGIPLRKIVGVLLLAIGALVLVLLTVLGGLFAGLLFGSPFLICGVICLVCEKHPGLWCAWAVLVLVDLYLRYATGIHWSSIFLTFRWTPQMNYMRLLFAWLMFLVPLVLVAATAVILRRDRSTGEKQRLILCCILLIALFAAHWGMSRVIYGMIERAGGYMGATELPFALLNGLQNIIDWARTGAFTAALTELLRLRKRVDA